MSGESTETPLSPTWKRPTDVMKMRSKRRSAANERVPLRPFNSVKSPSGNPHASPIRKRRNPFTCSPSRKKLNLGSEVIEANADSDFMLFQMLDKADNKLLSPTNKSSSSIPEVEVGHESKEEDIEEPEAVKFYPLDWSLKSKIRFISSKTFGWSGPLRSQEEANGLNLYVRNLSELPVNGCSEQSELRSASMYWMHPNLPWLSLFPRQVQDSKIGKSSVTVLDDSITSQLHRDWTLSFSSLFTLLKTNVCPYFYVLTHQFTVLFRCSAICQGTQNALLTPTTRGFREALTSDGIQFKMPLTSDEDSATNDDDIQTTDSGATMFLESIGVDRRIFPELNPDKVKMEREDYKRIDSRPESLIQVEGEETKQLFNYLLNCRSCIANTGVQAGVPPTLLAPVAFNGGTLRSLQIKQGSVRQNNVDNTPMKMFTLEMIGPLLPDNVARITELVSRTQGPFTASLSTQESTVSLNDRRTMEAESYMPKNGCQEGFLSRNRPRSSVVRNMEYKNESFYFSGS